ncbi:MAG: metallophosphoesterase [Polyangiales bacterium]
MSVGRIFIFLSVVFGLSFAIHFYLWARLVRDPALPEPWRQVATVALVILGLSVPSSMLVWRILPRVYAIPIAWLGYLWMGVMFVTLMLLWGGEFVRWGWVKYAQLTVVDPGRRDFLAQMLAGGTAALALAVSGWGIWSAVRPVEVKRLTVKLKNLPQSLSGFRLVQLTDVHVGPTIGREFIEDVVGKVNELNADAIAITGDLIDGSVREIGEAVRPLGDMRSTHGTFFVTGNHEYYSGADEWLAFLTSIGIQPLRNQCIALGEGDECLQVAGVDDWTAHQFGNGHGSDMRRALASRDASKPVVLLAHQPIHFDQAKEHGVDLQISGHTHGGQIFPFGLLTRLVQPFVSGLHQRGDTQIYVSSGTGYWGPPMRIAAPAEITLIELEPQTAS